MKLPPERPVSLALSFALIRAASLIVPATEQGNFQHVWQQKLFHRWQFLRQTDLWNSGEEFRMLAGALAVLPDAAQHFAAQDSVRANTSRFIQSPFTCLGALVVLLLLVAAISGGFPATRDLFFKRVDSGNSKLVYVWAHNLRGGGDRPLPSDVIQAWKTHSQLIDSAVAFRAVHRDVLILDSSGKDAHKKLGSAQRRLVVITEPDFFKVFSAQLMVSNSVSNSANPSADYVLLSYRMWMDEFHATSRVKGSTINIAGQTYQILGILPESFAPLSREPALYLVEPNLNEKDAFAAIRAKAAVTRSALDKEFTEVAQDVTFYFLNGQLRFGFAASGLWEPVRSFGYALFASILMLFVVFRLKWRMLVPQEKQAKVFARRAGFFAAKTLLALLVVFTACLEWSRSSSAILFGNFDPASGPFLLWLYILGAMGALFWTTIDQKARCRHCQQLLAFPVRMGSPGSVLLDWSGTELCCTQGHGVLHVPHLAPSWADESDHWIALDESWKSVFGNNNESR